MLDDLTKTFFDTFGIEPKKGCTAYDKLEEQEADTICNDECLECLYFDDRYPQITDRILLELICIINKHSDFGLFSSKIDELKDEILDHCLVLIGNDTDYTTGFEEEIKSQVQELFKE